MLNNDVDSFVKLSYIVFRLFTSKPPLSEFGILKVSGTNYRCCSKVLDGVLESHGSANTQISRRFVLLGAFLLTKFLILNGHCLFIQNGSKIYRYWIVMSLQFAAVKSLCTYSWLVTKLVIMFFTASRRGFFSVLGKPAITQDLKFYRFLGRDSFRLKKSIKFVNVKRHGAVPPAAFLPGLGSAKVYH